MTMTYVPTPLPPRTGWGVILPATLPPGGAEPYSFDFNLDLPQIVAIFNRPLSPLGDELPATPFSKRAAAFQIRMVCRYHCRSAFLVSARNSIFLRQINNGGLIEIL